MKDVYLHQRWLQKYAVNDKKDVCQYFYIAFFKKI